MSQLRLIRWKIGCMLLVLGLVLSLLPSVGYAAGGTTSDSSANELQLTVQYPDTIQCGVPLTFHVQATGGSGNYLYRLASLLVYDGSEWVQVYDVSYGSNSTYSESNEWQFTFYTSGTYYLRFSVMDVGVTPNVVKTTGFYENYLKIEDSDYPSVKSIVKQVAAECEAACSTDYEKALWLHDWLIHNADYDYSYSYCSAEGVLARGKGTCESYHRAYVMLLKAVGIDTGRITGNNHVWTAAKLDGVWTQIDTTWDDMGDFYSGSFYEHLYFGLNDTLMGLVHSDHTSAVTGYECTSLEENYFIKSGEIATWSDPYVPQIQAALEAGSEEFTLVVPTALASSTRNVIYQLVAYQLNQTDWGEAQVTVTYVDGALHCLVTYPEPEEEETEEPEEEQLPSEEDTPEEPADSNTEETESPEDPEENEPQETETPEDPEENDTQVAETPEDPEENEPQETETPEDPEENEPQETETPEDPEENNTQVTETPEDPEENDTQVAETPEDPEENNTQVTETPEAPEENEPQETETPEAPEENEPQETETPEDPEENEPQETETPEAPEENEPQETETPEEPEETTPEVTETPEKSTETENASEANTESVPETTPDAAPDIRQDVAAEISPVPTSPVANKTTNKPASQSRSVAVGGGKTQAKKVDAASLGKKRTALSQMQVHGGNHHVSALMGAMGSGATHVVSIHNAIRIAKMAAVEKR